MSGSVFMAASSPANPPSPHSYFAPGFPFYQVYLTTQVVLGRYQTWQVLKHAGFTLFGIPGYRPAGNLKPYKLPLKFPNEPPSPYLF